MLDAVALAGRRTRAPRVDWLPVDDVGRVARRRAARGARARRRRRRVITVMWANNEVGTVQPIARAGRGRRRGTASRCTPTPCRPSASSRSTSPRAAPSAISVTGAQARRPATASARCCCGRDVASYPAAARRRPGARRALRHPRRPRRGGLRRGGRARSTSSAERAARSPRLRDELIAGVLDAVAGRRAQRAPADAAAARQRALQLPRLRRRLAADAARRAADRVLDRARRARPAWRSRHTCCWRWAPTPPRRAASLRFSLGRTTRRADVDAVLGRVPARGRAGAASGAGRERGSADEGARRDERRRRLVGRCRPRGRRRPRRRGCASRAVATPGTLRTGSRGCCTIEDACDARRVADMLGIPYYVWDFADEFEAGCDRGLCRSNMRPGATPEPVCAVQREDQVLGAGRPARWRSVSTRSSPDTTPGCRGAGCAAPWTSPRTSRTCSRC